MQYSESSSCLQEQCFCKSENNFTDGSVDEIINNHKVQCKESKSTDIEPTQDECDGANLENNELYSFKKSLPCIDTTVDQNLEQQTKARNREHAKNARIQQKNYIETLKHQLMEFANVHDSREKDRKTALSTLAEKTSLRKSVLETWFQYRTTMESDLTKWHGILEEDFQCTMPVTPYRSFPPYQVQNGRRKVSGIADMVFDCLSLHVMLRSSVTPRSQTHLPKVSLFYEVSQESVMATDTFMCKWRISTEDLVDRGAMFEVSKQGMLLAVFSEHNKLHSLELSFDVMSFMQQLRRSTVRKTFLVVPNIIYKHHTANELQSLDNVDLPYAMDRNRNGSPHNSKNKEAFSAFMSASDPQVILSATEPHMFLFNNIKFVEIFRPHKSNIRTSSYNMYSISDNIVIKSNTAILNDGDSIPTLLFRDLVRVNHNHLKIMAEIQEFIMSKQPCTAMLNCSTDEDPSAILPCLCCFYPLFDNDAVQQYLLTLEVVQAATVRLTSEALDKQAASTVPLQQHVNMHCAPSFHGSVKSGNSGGTLGVASSGSGATDQASGSSNSPTEMDIAPLGTTSSTMAPYHHHSARQHENKWDVNNGLKAKASQSPFSNTALLTSHGTTTTTSNTDLPGSELDSSSQYDGKSAVGSEDRWIRDFTQTYYAQDQLSSCSHSLNPSVADRSTRKLYQHGLQEAAGGSNKSARMGPVPNSSTAEMSSVSALSDSRSSGSSSHIEVGSSGGNESCSDNGNNDGSGNGGDGQSPPGGGDSLSSDQMQVLSTEHSSPTVSCGSGNGSPGHSSDEAGKEPRRGSSGSEDTSSQKSGDDVKKKKDRAGHAVKKRYTYSSPTQQT